MFSSILAPLERFFSSSRAQATTVSAKLDEGLDKEEGRTIRVKKEFINHLQVPASRREVPLSDLLQDSKRKTGMEMNRTSSLIEN